MKFEQFALLVLALFHPIAQASVIGIDFGSDWFKVSIVKPGVPLDIVLNRESKRKTDSLVTIRDGIRYFGTDAAGLSTRFPETTYPFIKNLLGLSYNDPIAVEYRALYSNNMVPEPLRNTCAFSVGKEGTVYTVEELLAMQLAHAKRQAEISGGEGVSGAVITVPAYLNHFERQSIVDAAEIAGVRLLQLMNDGTAIALNYAMTRTITDPQYHIFFDMGAGSTVATLARFTSQKVKKVQVPTIEILAVGYDKKLGGKTLDIKLQKFLAKQFMKSATGSKAQEPILNNARSMAKLLKEANRVKQILSANTETIASVEGLHEEIDFKAKVTRSELETLMGADYFKKVLEPIKRVLKEADVPLKKLDSLILVGGAVRIPSVQTALKELVGEDKIAQNVNQDEANVLGAGFRAAGISKQFKVREIKIKDIAQIPIEVIYNLEPQGSETVGKTTHTTLYTKNTTLPSKKLMNFKRTTDFSFQLAYRDTQTPILSGKVSGVADAIAKHKETAAELPKVQAQIDLTDSLLLNVESAIASFELKPVVAAKKDGGSIAENVMNFFGGKKDKKEDGKKEDGKKEDVKKDEAEQKGEKTEKESDKKDGEKKEDESKKDESKKEEGSAKKDDKKADKKADKKKNATEPASNKITTEKVKLTVELKYETLPPLTQEVKDAAKKRFAAMDEEDASRRAREEAMNNLEAYIYSTQEFLESEKLLLVSTESQREALSEKVGAAAVWLDDVGFEAATPELKEQLALVKTVRAPMYHRVQELEKRPIAVAGFRETLEKATQFVEGIRLNNTAEGHIFFGLYEESEFEAGHVLIKEAEDWLVKKEEAQAAVAAHETPAFKAKEVDARAEELISVIVRKFNKMPKKPVVKPTKAPKTTTTTATSDAAGSAETEKPAATETPVAGGEKGSEKAPVEDGSETKEDSSEKWDDGSNDQEHSEL
ncbi:Hsp70 protein-domain-containing protein [Obelidium mucronatum]|nr:Hsp70 protein-domain-containing protein [Obelidium mucronatum]